MNDRPVQQSHGASAAAIQSHYDLSNDFYRLWLDQSMTYSCALWYGDEDLSAAQMNKIDWHLDRAVIKKGDHLLDVGCGWGALLERAVKVRGAASAVGLTFSKAQADHVKSAGNPAIEARLESWAVHTPKHQYDGIVSVGAFEHFAGIDESEEAKL